MTSSLRATISEKVWLTVPAGAFLKLHDLTAMDTGEVTFDISCDFLDLPRVEELLRGLQPQGISKVKAMEVLSLLDKLGILVWVNEPGFQDLVMLNPRRLAMAMAKVMTLCFGVDNFEHRDLGSQDDIKLLRSFEHHVAQNAASNLLRFRATGIATRDFINSIWKKDNGLRMFANGFKQVLNLMRLISYVGAPRN